MNYRQKQIWQNKLNKGIYYYTTYDNHQITTIDIHKENLDGKELISYPLIKEEQIRIQN